MNHVMLRTQSPIYFTAMLVVLLALGAVFAQRVRARSQDIVVRIVAG